MEWMALGSFLVILGLGMLSSFRWVPVLGLLLYSLVTTYNAVPFLSGADGKPNLLLITIDTLRKDALSCYGSKNPTPVLDALAQKGVLYEQAYSTAPWTLPSILSLLTGLYPSALGLGIETDPNQLPPLTHESEPLALVLHRAGYRTLGLVSNFWLTQTRKLDIGFDTYKNFPDEYSPALDNPQPFFLRLSYWMFEPQTASSGSFLLDEAYQRLKKGNGAFFLWVHLIEPHLPYNSQVNTSEFKGSKGNLKNFAHLKMDQGSIKKGVWKFTPEARQFYHWWYEQEVREVDSLLGQFLERLQKEGYLENTLTVVAADHGEEFWDHGGVIHGHTLYNELVQVPLIFHYPSQLAPSRISTKVSHVQVYPTLLKLLGISKLQNPTWRTDSLEKSLPFFFSESLLYFEDRKALFSQEGWKWIYFYGQTSEIYNLAQDPKELNPLKINIPEEWKKNFESWKQEN
ncbi:MAG: sulfatase, partial [Planctomycetota bacterium]